MTSSDLRRSGFSSSGGGVSPLRDPSPQTQETPPSPQMTRPWNWTPTLMGALSLAAIGGYAAYLIKKRESLIPLAGAALGGGAIGYHLKTVQHREEKRRLEQTLRDQKNLTDQKNLQIQQATQQYNSLLDISKKDSAHTEQKIKSQTELIKFTESKLTKAEEEIKNLSKSLQEESKRCRDLKESVISLFDEQGKLLRQVGILQKTIEESEKKLKKAEEDLSRTRWRRLVNFISPIEASSSPPPREEGPPSPHTERAIFVTKTPSNVSRSLEEERRWKSLHVVDLNPRGETPTVGSHHRGETPKPPHTKRARFTTPPPTNVSRSEERRRESLHGVGLNPREGTPTAGRPHRGETPKPPEPRR